MSMKRINVVTALLTGALACGLADRASAEVVAYWPFGISGLADASGHGNTLVKSDAGVVLSNGAALLDGSQTKLSTILPLDLSGYSNLTVEFWMRTTSTTGPGIMLEHTESFNDHAGAFLVDVSEGGAGNVVGGFLTGSGHNLDTTPTGVANDGAWHHIALVYDATKAGAERSVLYFDGQPQSTWDGHAGDGPASFCNAYLYIGSRANKQFTFTGDLDDIRISNTALAPSQFLQTRSAEEPRLVAYWPFDRGNELADASGHGNALVSGSGVVFSNGVAVMSGSQTAFGTAAALDLTACSSLTIECFLRTTASEGASMVLEHSANATNNPGAFAVSRNENTLTGGFRTDDGGNCDSTGTGTELLNGAWHHVALVYDAASNGADRVRLYVDQVRQTPSGVYTNDVLSAFRNEVLYIGTRANGEQPFIGEMDDVRIVDAALATSQFMNTRTDDTPPVIAYWPFAHGGVQADASGHGFTLALKDAGAVAFKDGSAVFTGHGGLYTPNHLDLSPFKALTVEFFIRTTDTKGPLVAELSRNYNDIPGAFALSAGMMADNKAGGGYRTSNGFNIEEAATGAITDGAWHHIAYVIDLTAASGVELSRLYLDGIRQTRVDWANSSAATPFASDQSLFLGWRGSTGNYNFIGDVDDVRITGAALSTNDFMSAAARTEDIATNAVIAFWPFDSANGLADASGHGNTLTGDGVTFTQGEAIFGGFETLRTANNLDLRPYSAVTLEYFIWTTSTGAQMILEQSPNYNNVPGAFYSLLGDWGVPGMMDMAFRTVDGVNMEATAGGVANDGMWHHIAQVIDTTKSGADRVQLYFDSVRQPKYLFFNSGAPTPLVSDILYIGSRDANSLQFVGRLDDIRITGKALTPAEFLTRPTTVLPPVVAYWPFERNRELEDASGNGYTLSNSGVTFNALSGSAVFNGSQEAFCTPKNLDFRWCDALTVECFVKAASANEHILLETSASAPFYQGAFVLSTLAGSGRTESAFVTAADSFFDGTTYRYNVDRSDEGKTLTDGKWHHLALVIDPAKAGADRARLYFDRVQQTLATADNSDLATAFLNAPLYIGSRANSESKFSGELDDVRITGVALTPDQFLAARSIPKGTLIQLR